MMIVLLIHSGNILFRELVNDYKPAYQTAPKGKKSDVADNMVRRWRNLYPPGRFLAKRKDHGELWIDVGDEAARRRAAKSLGERSKQSSSPVPPGGGIDSSSSAAVTGAALFPGQPLAMAESASGASATSSRSSAGRPKRKRSGGSLSTTNADAETSALGDLGSSRLFQVVGAPTDIPSSFSETKRYDSWAPFVMNAEDTSNTNNSGIFVNVSSTQSEAKQQDQPVSFPPVFQQQHPGQDHQSTIFPSMEAQQLNEMLDRYRRYLPRPPSDINPLVLQQQQLLQQQQMLEQFQQRQFLQGLPSQQQQSQQQQQIPGQSFLRQHEQHSHQQQQHQHRQPQQNPPEEEENPRQQQQAPINNAQQQQQQQQITNNSSSSASSSAFAVWSSGDNDIPTAAELLADSNIFQSDSSSTNETSQQQQHPNYIGGDVDVEGEDDHHQDEAHHHHDEAHHHHLSDGEDGKAHE